MKRVSAFCAVCCLLYFTVASGKEPGHVLSEEEGKLGTSWHFQWHEALKNEECSGMVDIAVEGGGTNTRIQWVSRGLQSQTVEVQPYKEGRPSNIYVDAKRAAETIRKLVDQQLLNQVEPDQAIHSSYSQGLLDTTCYRLGLGLAGTEAGRETVEAFFLAFGHDRRMQKAVLVSDAEITWRSVFEDEGVIIISGTGGVVLGRNSNGELWRASGNPSPVSGRPSGTTLANDYFTCHEKSVSLIDGQLTWMTGNNMLWPAGDSHSLFDHLLRNKRLQKGFGNLSEADFHRELMFDVSNRSTYAKIIYDYASFSIDADPAPGYAVTVPDDRCAYNAAVQAAIDMKGWIMSIDSAENADHETAFAGLPYYVHGSLGQRLIEDMEDGLLPTGDMQSYFTRRVKETVDPLSGAFKLLQELN